VDEQLNKDFSFVGFGKEGDESEPIDMAAIGAFVHAEYARYRHARREKEDVWMECWAVYNGSPQALDYARRLATRTVGDANTSWRHKVSTGKAFENIETINSYLQSAFFPNRDWFDITPLYSGSSEVTDVIKKFLKTKLKQSNFRSHWDMFTRQLLITGTSVLALPWRKEVVPHKCRVKVEYPLTDEGGTSSYKQKPMRPKFKVKTVQKQIYSGTEFETLSMFDCFFDPDEVCDVNRANFVRRMVKTKGEVVRLINTGFYPHLTVEDVVRAKNTGTSGESDNRKNTLANFNGMQWQPSDLVEIVEFWGNATTSCGYYEDVVITCMGNKVGKFENNPYWGGKPFVVGTYIAVPHQTYGVGAIEPVLGMLHELSIVTNQRLDNLELSIDSMWTFVDDGVLNPEDLYTAPGKLIEVADHSSLRPVVHNQQFTVTYQESGLLEQTIDKVTGTGAFIGVGQGRGGERVTAQEVQATRDAGGNRLGGVHSHIESTALHLTLKKVYRMCQQFVTEDEVIRIPGFEPGEYLYVEVGVEELHHDFDIEPVGAGHIADKEYELQKRLDFVGLVSQNPEMAQMMQWSEIMKDLAKRFGFDDIERFIKPPAEPKQNDPMMGGEPPMEGEPSPDDLQQLMQAMGESGGKPAQDMAQAQLATDGGEAAIADKLETLGIQ